MSEQTQGAPMGEPAGGVTPPAPPAGTGVTPSPPAPEPDPARREAGGDQGDDDQAQRDAALDREELTKALNRERRTRREADRELKRLRDAEAARTDAEKTELQRATERAEAAEARLASMERAALAQQVAREEGIPDWADELRGDDARALRTHAQRIRERLGRVAPGMDGGARGLGVPPAPQSMDDLIRAGARR